MSVINNVLKDLENRESGFDPIEVPSLDGRVEGKPVLKPALMVMLILVPMVAVGGYLWQNQGDVGTIVVAGTNPVATIEETMVDAEPLSIEAEPLEPVAMVVVEPEPEPAEIAPRNQIIGLQIREADDAMELEFVLRNQVVAYVTERSENTFAYHLREIDSQIVAPVLRDNRWLQSLEISPAGDGVDIRFQTVDGILVETRQHQAEDGRAWSIGFRQPEPEPVVAINASQLPARSVTEPLIEADAEEVSEPVIARIDPAIQAPEEVKLEIRTSNPNATDVNRLRYALDLINTGRHADAEKLLRDLLHGSEDRAARTHLLALYGHQNRQDRLARLAQDSLTRYPEDQVFLTEFARARYQAKAYRSALDLLSSIPRFNADQHALAAACHQRLEHHERAIEHYLKALKIDAANAKNWVGLGISQEHTADIEKALQSYQNAARLGSLNGRLQSFVEKRSATLAQVVN